MPGHDYEGRDLEAMAFALNYSAWIRDEFAGAVRGDAAEVGAGDGRFASLVLELKPRSLTLFEPSTAMFLRQAERLQHAAGVRRENSTLAAAASRYERAFDVVIYNNVLEHVEDDAAELKLLRNVLRPNGLLCVFVPALPMLMSDFDRRIGHLRRYTRRSLSNALHGSGMLIERLHYVDMVGVLPWLVAMRWMKGDLDQRKTAAYDRLAVPVVRALESIVRPPIGKNLLAIARNPAP